MKGKVLSLITAILFGATMVATPIVIAAGTDDTIGAAGTEEQAPAPAKKKPAKKKKATKKKAATKKSTKKSTKKKTSKKKKKAPESAPEDTQ
jgi:predicted dienelactone hydrolase